MGSCGIPPNHSGGNKGDRKPPLGRPSANLLLTTASGKRTPQRALNSAAKVDRTQHHTCAVPERLLQSTEHKGKAGEVAVGDPASEVSITGGHRGHLGVAPRGRVSSVAPPPRRRTPNHTQTIDEPLAKGSPKHCQVCTFHG